MSTGFYRSKPFWKPKDGRVGPWIQTYTGRRFYFLDPRPEDIVIEDIAWALGHLCRFNGHVRRFYSVAEHSMLVSAALPPKLQLAGLLHDAAEAYTGDVTRPLKHLVPAAVGIEAAVALAIRRRFDLGSLPAPEIKAADMALLADERREVLGRTGEGAQWDWDPGPGFGIAIPGWPPAEAAERFLQRFLDLTGAKDAR